MGLECDRANEHNNDARKTRKIIFKVNRVWRDNSLRGTFEFSTTPTLIVIFYEEIEKQVREWIIDDGEKTNHTHIVCAIY